MDMCPRRVDSQNTYDPTYRDLVFSTIRFAVQWASMSGYLAISPNIAKIRQSDKPHHGQPPTLRRYCYKNTSL